MNRELKFRIWDKRRKKYNEDGYYKNELISIALGLGSECCISKDDLIVQQYIGVNDSFNKEIYEGDIIYGYVISPDESSRISCNPPNQMSNNVKNIPHICGKFIGEVVFDNFQFKCINSKQSLDYYDVIEVIGHKYEDRELSKILDFVYEQFKL